MKTARVSPLVEDFNSYLLIHVILFVLEKLLKVR